MPGTRREWARIFRAHAEDAAITLAPRAGDLTHAGALFEMVDADRRA